MSEQKLRNYHAENLSPSNFASRKTKKCQPAVLSAENEAFEKLETQRILHVAQALKNLIKIAKKSKKKQNLREKY
jgi:hypothetical protein